MINKYSLLYEKFIFYCIILFPFIDIASSFQNRLGGTSIEIGVFSRGIIYLLLAIYLIGNLKHLKNKIIFYLIVLMFLLIGSGFIINLFEKDPFSLGVEIKFIFKVTFFFLAFMYFYLSFLKNSKFDIQTPVVISSLLYNIFIWVPSYLGISFNTYKYMKSGSIGWFYSANEISALIGILFSFVVIDYFKNRDNTSLKRKLISILSLLSFLPSFYLIGTKVALGLGILYSLVLTLIFLYESIKDKKIKLLGIAFLVELFILFGAPAVSNTEKHIEVNEETQQEKGDTNEVTDGSQSLYPEPINPIINTMLSDRDVYVLLHTKYFDKASFERKLFGMGYASEYKQNQKTTEMDFFDIFFSFGVIFSLIFMLFSATLGWKIFNSIKSLKNNVQKVVYSLAVLVICGVSFLTGHILVAPAVNFFWAALLAFIMNEKTKTL